ncbi:hypothetical protein T492DRAFT_58838 [Pavlovales sp. CCMP2436]|nr:hypothetical protein T492DRAFT_58838 [Pavlovales sp. CCMP2436]
MFATGSTTGELNLWDLNAAHERTPSEAVKPLEPARSLVGHESVIRNLSWARAPCGKFADICRQQIGTDFYRTLLSGFTDPDSAAKAARKLEPTATFYDIICIVFFTEGAHDQLIISAQNLNHAITQCHCHD